MLSLADIHRKLAILNDYDRVFRVGGVRQQLPECCGRTYDLGDLLQMEVRQVPVEVEGVEVMMFEVLCPQCGAVVPPKWGGPQAQ